MDKKRILIVGFGGIGCRHAQSFLDKKKDYEGIICEIQVKIVIKK